MFGRKATVKTETINDDFNLDDGLDMGGFDFDADPMKDDRKPVTKVLDGALEGIKTGVKDTSFLKKTVKDILPEGYGKTMDLHDKINGSIRDLYDETAKEVKPAIKEFKKISAKLIPTDSRFIPTSVQEMLQKWRDDQEEEKRDSSLGEDTQKEQFLSMQMADIFQAQSEDKVGEKKEKDAKDNIQQGIDLERHRDLLGVVSNIDQAVSRIDQYGRTVGLNFQKKTLELMYRQLFALQDLVKIGEKGFGIMANELPAIKKNTALPEFVKQTNTEFLKEYNKKKLVETIGRNLFGTGAEYLDKVLGNFSKNLKSKFKDGLGQFRDGVVQADELHSTMKEMQDMPGMDKYGMAGNMAGTKATETIFGQLGKWTKKNVLGKSERVNKLGHKLMNASIDAPRAINEFREKNANSWQDTLWGKMKGGVASLLSPYVEHKGIEGQDSDKLGAPGTYSKRTERSINEVIPGFLARILREVKILRTGNTDTELEVFDHVKNKFSDEGKLEKRIFDSVIDSRSKDSMHGQLDRMIQDTGGENLSPEAKKALKKRLTMTSANGKRMSQENFDQEGHYEGPGAAEAAAHMKQYFEKHKDNQDAQTNIKRNHDYLGAYVTNTMGDVEKNADLGYTEQLQKAGFLEEDGKSISRDKIIEHYLNKEEKPPEAKGAPPIIPGAHPPIHPHGGPTAPSGGPAPTSGPTGGSGDPSGGPAPAGTPPGSSGGSGLGTPEEFVGPIKPKTRLQRLAGSVATDIGDMLENTYKKGSSAVKGAIEVLDSKDPKAVAKEKVEKLIPKKWKKLYKDGLLDRYMVIEELKMASKRGGKELEKKIAEIKQLNKDGGLNIENLALIAQGKPPKLDSTTPAVLGAPVAPQALSIDGASEKPKAFAKGGVFSNQVLHKATPFSFEQDGQERPAVAGEAGPEAVMPLTQQGVRAVDAQGEVKAHLPVTRDKHGILSVEHVDKAKETGKKALSAVTGFFSHTREALEDIIADKAHELKKSVQTPAPEVKTAPVAVKKNFGKNRTNTERLLDKLDELILAVQQTKLGSAIGSTMESVGQSAFSLMDKAKQATGALLDKPEVGELRGRAKKKFLAAQHKAEQLKASPKLTALQAAATKKLEEAKKSITEAKMPPLETIQGHLTSAKQTATKHLQGLTEKSKTAEGRAGLVGDLKNAIQAGQGKLEEKIGGLQAPAVLGGGSLASHIAAGKEKIAAHIPESVSQVTTGFFDNAKEKVKVLKYAAEVIQAKQHAPEQVQTAILKLSKEKTLTLDNLKKELNPTGSLVETTPPKTTTLKEHLEHAKSMASGFTDKVMAVKPSEVKDKFKNKAEQVAGTLKDLHAKKALTLGSVREAFRGKEAEVKETQDPEFVGPLKPQTLKEKLKAKVEAAKSFGSEQIEKGKAAFEEHQTKPEEPRVFSKKKRMLDAVLSFTESAKELADKVGHGATDAGKIGTAFVHEKLQERAAKKQAQKTQEEGVPFKERDEITGDLETVLRKNLHGIQVVLDKSEDHLAKILKAIESGGMGGKGKRSWWPFGRKDKHGGEEEPNYGSGVSGLVGRGAAGVTSLAGKGLGLAGRTFAKTASMNLTAINWAAKKVLPSGPKDIYVEGEDRPRLYAARLREGLYFKKISKKPLIDIKDLDEPILDEEGNEILTEEDLKKVYVKSIGGRAKKILGGIGRIGGAVGRGLASYGGLAKKVIGFEVDLARGGFNLAKRAVKGAYNMLDAPADVYTPGIEDPVMVATVMKHGGYTSKLTGKVIQKPTEIDGPVLDKEGNTVLTTDQLRKGIYNAKGDKFKTPMEKLLGVAGGVAKTVWGVHKAAWGITRKIGEKMLGGFKGLAGGLFDGLSVEINGAKSLGVLSEIRDMLRSHFGTVETTPGTPGKEDSKKPGEKKIEDPKKPDITKDEKGFKIGSWQDLKIKAEERMKEKKEKLKDGFAKMREGAGKVKHKLLNPMELFRDLKGLVTGTLGKISGLIGGVKNLFSMGKSAMGMLGKLGRIGGMAARVLPMAANLASGAVGMLGSLGSSAIGAAGVIAEGAVGLGGAIAGGLGTMGAGLMTFLASPVVLGVAAAAAVGYAGYKIYKHFKDKMTPLDSVRLVQYGFKKDDKDNYKKVLELERYCIDFVSYSKENCTINDNKMKTKDLLSAFDIDAQKKDEFNLFFNWYQKRFKPVFLTHCLAIVKAAAQSKPDLSEIGNLKKEKALEYIDAAAFPDGPYDVGPLPLKEDTYEPAGSKDVSDNITAVKEEMGLDKIKKDESKGVDATAGAAGAAAVVAKPGEAGKKEVVPEKPKSVFEAVTDKVWNNKGKIAMVAAGAATGGVGFLIAGAAVVGYSLLSRMGKNKLMMIDNIRMVQYGFKKDDQDNYDKIDQLEDYCKDFLVFSENKMTINESKMVTKNLLKPFGLDPTNRKDMEQFFEWYQKRFKPVYLTHCAVMAQLKKTNKPDLSKISALKLDEQGDYLAGVALPDGPYEITTLPLEDKAQKASTAEDVKAIIAEFKKMLGKFAAPSKSSLIAGAAKPAGIQTEMETEEVDPATEKAGSQSSSSGVLGGATLSGKQTATAATVSSVNKINQALASTDEEEYGDDIQMQELVDLSTLKQDGKLNALEAIKFKAYGLKELEKSKMKAIEALEALIAKTMVYKNGSTDWSGSPLATLDEVKGYFGITDKIGVDANNWINWFMKRFLPVYLKYVSLWCAYAGQKVYQNNLGMIKVSQQQDMAKQIAGMSVWSENKTPFPNYVLNTNSDSVKENLEFLEKTVKQEKALEEKLSIAKQQPASSNDDKDKQAKEAASKNSDQTKALYGKTLNPDATQTGQSANKSEEDQPKASGSSGGAGSNGSSNPSGLTVADGPPLDGKAGSQWLSKSDAGVKLSGVNPSFLNQFYGMTEEFHQMTGKKITVTDGFRSFEDQVARKEKYGARAAAPGTSMHEFGLAMDADSKTLDEVDKLGLMRKYGFTRPVGGEPWHVEAIGTASSADKEKYKKNPQAATAAIEAGLNHGGGGQGTIANAPKNSRNDDLVKNTMAAKVEPIKNKDGTSASAPAGVAPGGAPGNTASPTGLAAQGGVTEVSKKDPKAVASNAGGGAAIPSSGGASGTPAATDESKPKSAPSTGGNQNGGNGASGAPNTASKDYNTKMADTGANGPALGGVKADLPSNPATKVPAPNGTIGSVKKTVEAAAEMVGIKPDIATSTVAIESGFNPNAKADSTTASGLYQFLKGTWREMLNKHGAKLGVMPGTSPFDASANAIMGAQYVKDNERILKSSSGASEVSPTDIYAAHFLGPYGAGKLIKAIKNNPDQPAQAVLPAAAASNESIFYENGNTSAPKSVKGVYDLLDKKVKTKASQFGIKVDMNSASPASADKGKGTDTPVDYGLSGGGASTAKSKDKQASAGAVPKTQAGSATPAAGGGTNGGTGAGTADTSDSGRSSGNNNTIMPPATPKTGQGEALTQARPVGYDFSGKTSQTGDNQSSANPVAKASDMFNVGKNPMDDVYGFSPKSADYGARTQMQNAQGFDASAMKPTEKILSDSLKVQSSMVDILNSIFGLLSKDGGKSKDSSSSNAGSDNKDSGQMKTAEDTTNKNPAGITHSLNDVPVKMRRLM